MADRGLSEWSNVQRDDPLRPVSCFPIWSVVWFRTQCGIPTGSACRVAATMATKKIYIELWDTGIGTQGTAHRIFSTTISRNGNGRRQSWPWLVNCASNRRELLETPLRVRSHLARDRFIEVLVAPAAHIRPTLRKSSNNSGPFNFPFRS
jgi:hypothetical protein